jgi:hypothetical protein
VGKEMFSNTQKYKKCFILIFLNLTLAKKDNNLLCPPKLISFKCPGKFLALVKNDEIRCPPELPAVNFSSLALANYDGIHYPH